MVKLCICPSDNQNPTDVLLFATWIFEVPEILPASLPSFTTITKIFAPPPTAKTKTRSHLHASLQ